MFADFVASFEDARVAGKTFVRGNTINPETKGKLFHFKTDLCGCQSELTTASLLEVECLKHPGASTIGS